MVKRFKRRNTVFFNLCPHCHTVMDVNIQQETSGGYIVSNDCKNNCFLAFDEQFQFYPKEANLIWYEEDKDV